MLAVLRAEALEEGLGGAHSEVFVEGVVALGIRAASMGELSAAQRGIHLTESALHAAILRLPCLKQFSPLGRVTAKYGDAAKGSRQPDNPATRQPGNPATRSFGLG